MGFENAREMAPLFYHHKVKVDTEQIHAIERYQLFVRELGLESSELDYNIMIPEKIEGHLDQLLAEEGIQGGRPMVVLNPNARWETKRWFPDLFAELADKLVLELNLEVILIGSKSERNDVKNIEVLSQQGVHNLAGKTDLLELAALLKRAHLMITCDSSPMHLAVALGTPVVALFGPTDPVRTGPFGSEHRVVKKNRDCAPCLKRLCPDDVRLCMASISVDDVFHEVEPFLSESPLRAYDPSSQ